MKLTIKTQTLKEMVAKASACASNNKLVPMTSLMCLSVDAKSNSDNQLTMVTTDATNFLYVMEPCECADGFYAVCYTEQFMKLIPKITTEKITLVVEDGVLYVQAKGKYAIELPIDTDGGFVKYPDPLNAPAQKQLADRKTGTIKDGVIKAIIKTIEPALADTMEQPVLTHYYSADKIIGADGCVISEYADNLFDGEAMMISQPLMKLLDILEGDIKYSLRGNSMVFSDEHCILYAQKTEDAGDYYVSKTTEFLATEFENTVKVNKGELLAALDRINIFVGKLDDSALSLTFTPEELVLANIKEKSVESVPYTETNFTDEYACYINVNMLTEQLKAYTGEVVTIKFGGIQAIELYTDTTKQIISLMIK